MLNAEIRKLSLETLRIVSEVLRAGSVTQIARASGMTQPAVTFHIRKFEIATGLNIRQRVGNDYCPTAHAEEIRDACQTVLRRMSQLSDYSRSRADRRRKVGIAHEVLVVYLAEGVLSSETTQRFCLVVDDAALLAERFEKGELDAVIRPLFPLEAQPELITQVRYRWFIRRKADAWVEEDGMPLPIVRFPTRTPIGSLTKHYLDKHVASFRVVIEASDLTMVQQMAEAGVGFAYLPQHVMTRKAFDAVQLPKCLSQQECGYFGLFYRAGAINLREAETLFEPLLAHCASTQDEYHVLSPQKLARQIA